MFNRILKRYYSNINHLSANNLLINQVISKNISLKIYHILAGLNLKKVSSKCKKLEDVINLAFIYQYTLHKWIPYRVSLDIFQKKNEILNFCKGTMKKRPEVVLEIGTAQGGTLFLLTKIANERAILISMALPGIGKNQGYFPYRIPFYKMFASKSQKIKLIRQDSHKQATLRKIKNIIKNKKIDLLFIDGDHSYEGVKKDFEMYAPLVRDDGIIAFHDIVDIPDDGSCDVLKFWNEIKHDYEYQEFVEDWNQGNCGLGVIKKKVS
jgi:cephalosporin hydroxylase